MVRIETIAALTSYTKQIQCQSNLQINHKCIASIFWIEETEPIVLKKKTPSKNIFPFPYHLGWFLLYHSN